MNYTGRFLPGFEAPAFVDPLLSKLCVRLRPGRGEQERGGGGKHFPDPPCRRGFSEGTEHLGAYRGTPEGPQGWLEGVAQRLRT